MVRSWCYKWGFYFLEKFGPELKGDNIFAGKTRAGPLCAQAIVFFGRPVKKRNVTPGLPGYDIY